MKMLRLISRILVGMVFLFSGFVKGIDPLGTMFKIEDYFIAYGTEWALPLALSLSIILCIIEFTIGVFLILNIKPKIIPWLLFMVMSTFLIVTLFDALYNPVPDCGCFGDALVLTNWQTFNKNLVLMVFVLIILVTQKHSNPSLSVRKQNITAIILLFLFSGLTIYASKNLPMIDFREWKVGQDLTPHATVKPKTYLIYKNLQTGEEKEMLSNELPWNDSVWMSQWEFVDQRVDHSLVTRSHELQIIDKDENDITDLFIRNPDYQFILTSYDLSKVNNRVFQQINDFSLLAEDDNYSFILLTNATNEEINKFKETHLIDYEIYNTDDIVLKTMIRSNPGLLLLKDGVIINKWHYRSFPDYISLKKNLLNNQKK